MFIFSFLKKIRLLYKNVCWDVQIVVYKIEKRENDSHSFNKVVNNEKLKSKYKLWKQNIFLFILV